MTSRYIPQLSFSFYRHRAIRADFSGGQITTDAGLLPLRAFDQRYGLSRGLAEFVRDDRDDSRVSHPGLSLLRQRLYQIIAGYEDANDANRLRHDPAFQILADQPLGAPLGSQPTLSRWDNSPTPRDLLKLQDALLDWFVKICGEQVANGERSCSMWIPLTIQRTDSSSSVSSTAVTTSGVQNALLGAG